MGSHKRTAQLALEWMALMNVYPVVLWVNYFLKALFFQKSFSGHLQVFNANICKINVLDRFFGGIMLPLLRHRSIFTIGG
jgi:hypothetical protein